MFISTLDQIEVPEIKKPSTGRESEASLSGTFDPGYFTSYSIMYYIFLYSGMAGSAVFIVISGYAENAIITVCFMSIAVAFFGFSFTGFMVNPLDIAPKYAGIIIGISNCVSTMPGFIGPSLVGIITKNDVSNLRSKIFATS